jgi:protein TonB
MDQAKKFALFGAASLIAHAIIAVTLSSFLYNDKEIVVSSLDSYKPLLITMNSGMKIIPLEKPFANNSAALILKPESRDISLASQQVIPLPDLTAKTTASNNIEEPGKETRTKAQQIALVTLEEEFNVEEPVIGDTNQRAPDVDNLDTKNAMINEKLNALVQRNFRYPGFAVKRGWEGTVKLGLRIEANGRLSNVRVIKTSGHSILDQAALTTLSQTNYIYGLESWLAGNYFDTTLPVQYQLIDG